MYTLLKIWSRDSRYVIAMMSNNNGRESLSYSKLLYHFNLELLRKFKIKNKFLKMSRAKAWKVVPKKETKSKLRK